MRRMQGRSHFAFVGGLKHRTVGGKRGKKWSTSTVPFNVNKTKKWVNTRLK